MIQTKVQLGNTLEKGLQLQGMRFDIGDGSPQKAPKHPSFLGNSQGTIGILKSAT